MYVCTFLKVSFPSAEVCVPFLQGGAAVDQVGQVALEVVHLHHGIFFFCLSVLFRGTVEV